MSDLSLPFAYEDIEAALGGGKHINAKLMQFVVPVEDAERQLVEVISDIRSAGRLVFLHGRQGIGKSTFIRSLMWRTHLRLTSLTDFDASEHPPETVLAAVLEEVRQTGDRAKRTADVGIPSLVINYLENLAGIPDDSVRAFYRSLNGVLRNYPVLVIWPTTDREDVDAMVAEAQKVTGTMFHQSREIIDFHGPDSGAFPSITRNTVSVLNDGKTIEDFGLTAEDLDEVLVDLRAQGAYGTTIRNYLKAVHASWAERTDQLSRIHGSVPRPTEIWFVFSYARAEDVVDQFARRSVEPAEAWKANHGKLYEYIHNNQRAAEWDAKRLQFAIGGAFITRVLYMPTNTLVALIASYGDGLYKRLGFSDEVVQAQWTKKHRVRRLLSTTPVLRQLLAQPVKLGKRRSGTVAPALVKAKAAFELVSRYASGSGPGSDEPLNQAVGAALRDVLPSERYSIEVETPHPWLTTVVPDIRVDTPDSRYICIEMCYTSQDDLYIAADYVLRKLNVYMKQLEHKVGRLA